MPNLTGLSPHSALPPRGADRRRRRGDRKLGLGLAAVVIVAGGWQQSRRLQREVAGLRRSVQAAEQERRGLLERVDAVRRSDESDRSMRVARTLDLQRREQETRLANAPGEEAVALRRELEATRARLSALENERTAGQRVIQDYGAGVCLIQASYVFYDEQGRPLRDRNGDDGQAAGSEDATAPDPQGPIHTVDYYGTGFLVDREGRILTNRHVAEPWWNDETAERLAAAGYKPRFVTFRAFFPREGEPFDLVPERRSDSMDLAILRVDLRGRAVPVLPLDRSGRGAVAGQPMMVMGYPTGLEAILAKAESNVVKQILETQGPSSERVTEALSRQGLIRPTTTQGHIGDVTRTDIVFDAATTQGGSGGPVFNKHGEVIAVEYALLTKFGGNSFAIPIAYALELLSASS
jgi:S1-C subfamily serine protease